MPRMIPPLLRAGLVALLIGAAITPAHAQGTSPKTYRVGVLVGLSGLGAQIGQWILQGAQTAAKSIDAAGGPVRFELIAEDTQWDPQKGVQGYNKLVTVDHIDALIAGGSAVMQAIAPLADQQQLVLLNVGAQSPSMAGIGKFTFSVMQLANFDVSVLARYAYDTMKIRNVAMLYVNNDTGKDDQVEFDHDFTRLGGKIVARESFRPNETNYGAQVAKVAASQPDAVYVVGTPAELPFAVRQLRAQLPNTQILSYAGLESQEFLNAAGGAANGIVYTTTWFDPNSDDPQTKAFIAAYQRDFGKPANSPYIVGGYDAIQILDAALTKSGSAGDKLRETIATTKRFAGAAGPAVFRDDGTVARAIAVKQIKDGKFELITVVQP